MFDLEYKSGKTGKGLSVKHNEYLVFYTDNYNKVIDLDNGYIIEDWVSGTIAIINYNSEGKPVLYQAPYNSLFEKEGLFYIKVKAKIGDYVLVYNSKGNHICTLYPTLEEGVYSIYKDWKALIKSGVVYELTEKYVIYQKGKTIEMGNLESKEVKKIKDKGFEPISLDFY